MGPAARAVEDGGQALEAGASGSFVLGVVLLVSGAALLRFLFERVADVLVGGPRDEELPGWGGSELLLVVGVVLLGVPAWYSLLRTSGVQPIDSLLATDLALFSGGLVAAWLAARSMVRVGRAGMAGRAFGLGSPPGAGGLGSSALFGVAALVLATPAILGVMNLWPLLLEAIGRTPMPQDVLLDVLSQDGVSLVVAVLLASLVGPALEEFLFRGFLQPALRSRVGVPGAIGLTSFIFASMHGFDAAGPVFCLSLLLGVLRERTGRLEVPILAHCLWNGTTLMLSLGLAQSAAS